MDACECCACSSQSSKKSRFLYSHDCFKCSQWQNKDLLSIKMLLKLSKWKNFLQKNRKWLFILHWYRFLFFSTNVITIHTSYFNGKYFKYQKKYSTRSSRTIINHPWLYSHSYHHKSNVQYSYTEKAPLSNNLSKIRWMKYVNFTEIHTILLCSVHHISNV